MEQKIFIEKHLGYLKKQQGRIAKLHKLAEEELTFNKPGKWSIAECLHHMILASRLYVDQMEKKLQNPKKSTNLPFKRGYLGKYFTYGILPNPDGSLSNKMKTMGVFEPKKSKKYPDYMGLNGKQLLTEFEDILYRIDNILKESTRANLNKNRIVTALGPLVQFKLGDAIAFMIAHNERHIHQIEKLKANLK